MTPSPAAGLIVNGVSHPVAPTPDRSLLLVLREELALTGAKPGCGEGACGACTVLLDGQPVRSCQVPIAEAAGREVRTIEGLAQGDALHPVQRAFLEAGAFQCGYCTAGMIMATVALLERDPAPGDEQVRAALHDNACRCCTYPRILRAVHLAAGLVAGSVPDRSHPSGPTGGSPVAPDPRALDGVRPRRPWDLTRLADRDYFAVLPDGLVVAHEPRPSEAAAWTTSSGAWVHVGGDGRVTAFTGKVDVGQDNRTALSMLVAEELRVPVSAVTLVMGDTDLCPHDQGTFGSRSMPDGGGVLRRAAAGARERLFALAADRLGVDAAALDAADGTITPSSGAPGVTYADLARGLRQVEQAAADARLSQGEGRVVGRPGPRVAGPAIVRGARRYPSDLALPGMLYGRVLRAPSAGATLRSVDTSRAAGLPGVTVVEDGPFVGIAATNPGAAARALASIAAAWDPPAVPEESDLAAWLRAHPTRDDGEDGWGGAFHQVTGDVESALAAAPTRLDATYTTAYIAHVPLETHVALAAWDEAGRLTVWTGTQVPFGVRARLADSLGVREEDIRVIVPDPGGGFGGKHAGEVAEEAARLARAAGRPVKVRWGRPEEFTEGYFRPAAVIDIRSGADRGRIIAWEMRNTNSGMFGLVGPYDVPHQRLDFQPAQSPFDQGSYRALAATANHFARESHMDELAAALAVDPLDFRLAHLHDERLAAVFRAAAERIGWGGSPGPGRGLGIAGGVEKGARVATAVEVRVGDDRRVEVARIATALDCGAIVNPDGLLNQAEGALVMGLGGALFEAVRFEHGVVCNASMSEYRVPRIDDVPSIDVVLLDQPDQLSAGGGETPIIAIAPAIANAVCAASGVRLRSLPLLPDGLLPVEVGGGPATGART